jgi:hypothetical protein
MRRRYPEVLAAMVVMESQKPDQALPKLRPDFIIPTENRIIDSKYKFWIESFDDDHGLMQLCQYSRYNPILTKCNNGTALPILQFLYPLDTGAKQIDFQTDINQPIDGYKEIYKYPISLL